MSIVRWNLKEAGCGEPTNPRASLWSDEQKSHTRLCMRVSLPCKMKPDSYTEALPAYSFSPALLSLGGLLNNLGLSSVKMCTVRPYFTGEQGCSQKQPRFRFAFGHQYFARCLAASYPSLCMRKPNLQTGTPSSSMVKSSLYVKCPECPGFRSIKGVMFSLVQYS